MHLDLERAVLQLARRETLRVTDARGRRVTCLSGTLWITQDGDRRDIILQPGESFRFDRHGLALVHATAASAIAIEEDRSDDAPSRVVFRFPVAVPVPAAALLSPAAR